MGLAIYVNTGTADTAYGIGTYTPVDVLNDSLIISAGSLAVADGQPIPSNTQLNNAGILLTGIEQTVSKYFLADASAGILEQIHNMGAGNKQYVIAFVFDAATASEPVLEVWDDTDMDSVDSVPLGAGTPASSWFRGITTTSNPPGVGWTGSRLAGSSDGNFLWLNDENGALSGATTLYAQLKVVIPASQVSGGTGTPILVCKYASV